MRKPTEMTTPYRDFGSLVLGTLKGIDYELDLLDRSSPVAIVAIHGGAIEPLTSELTRSIAGDDYSWYDFQGVRRRDNQQLRIPVSRFDEIRLRGLLRHCHSVLSVDGVPGDDRLVHVGGRNSLLKEALASHLSSLGYELGTLTTRGAAHNPQRFYNGTELGGLHMELPLALRREMLVCDLSDGAWRDPANWGQSYHRFVGGVRAALAEYCRGVQVDLGLTMERFEQATESFPSTLRQRGNHHH